MIHWLWWQSGLKKFLPIPSQLFPHPQSILSFLQLCKSRYLQYSHSPNHWSQSAWKYLYKPKGERVFLTKNNHSVVLCTVQLHNQLNVNWELSNLWHQKELHISFKKGNGSKLVALPKPVYLTTCHHLLSSDSIIYSFTDWLVYRYV